jgi:ABC-type proline/glycine betaine transport system ATPase subunit
MLIVTHDINTARTVPDNIGLLYRRHLAMFGPREMLLSSQEPVVRQFLNARRQGPIGMAEEKDAAELAAEQEEGEELPPLPPIPPQISPSNGEERRTQREAGRWLKENNVEPPPGSFQGEGSYANSAGFAPPASTDGSQQRVDEREGGSVRLVKKKSEAKNEEAADDAYPADDDKPTQRLRRPTAKKTAAKRAPAKRASRSSSDSDES